MLLILSISLLLDRYGIDHSTIVNIDEGKGPGWQTVPNNEFTKFTMRRSPAKKYVEPGTSVICINTKVSFIYIVFQFLYCMGCEQNRHKIATLEY